MKTYSYCFTINNYTDSDLANIMELCETDSVRYCIVGFEIAPSTGTPHLQGYVYYKNQRHICSLPGHISISRGNPMQNQTYCSKEGDFWEYGDLPEQGKACWDKICSAMEAPKDDPHTCMQYRKTYEYIKELEKVPCLSNIFTFVESSVELMNYLITCQQSGLTICTSVDSYVDEDVLICDFEDFYSSKKHIDYYENGIPWKIRRGFQIINICPTFIVKTHAL